jgi:hypothetical protein
MKLKKKLFMLKKILRDFHAPKNRYKTPDDLTSSELKDYYFIFEENRISKGKDQPLITSFDSNGIPLNTTYIDVENQRHIYFPISIGQMGLSIYHTYLKTRSDSDKQRFLRFADWFMTNADISDELGVRWLTHVELPQYHNPGPWQSAFSQSRGISILLRAHQITQKSEYLDYAEKALIPFTQPVAEGGVTSYTEWGPFYEEYTAEVPTLVLNGMIFSLWGIYDYCRAFPSNDLSINIFDEGVVTLKNILYEYNLGYWSRYNLCKAEWYPQIDPATRNYQRLHIAQLDVMYRITNDPIFKSYSNIFLKQDTVKNAVKAYKVKYSALKMIGRL